MIEIDLTKGQVALIDDEDWELVSAYKWFADCSYSRRVFYARANTTLPDGRRSMVLMHRLILGANKDQFVDHQNHNTLDNRRSNIRLCNRSENKRNSTIYSNNKSGLKGVTWHKQSSKWRADIQKDGKRFYLGGFGSAEAAYKAYCEAAIRLHGDFACLG